MPKYHATLEKFDAAKFANGMGRIIVHNARLFLICGFNIDGNGNCYDVTLTLEEYTIPSVLQDDRTYRSFIPYASAASEIMAGFAKLAP